MYHQIAVVPGFEGETAGQPAQRAAFLICVVESNDDHTSIVNPLVEDASLSESMVRGGKIRNHPRIQSVQVRNFHPQPNRTMTFLSSWDCERCRRSVRRQIPSHRGWPMWRKRFAAWLGRGRWTLRPRRDGGCRHRIQRCVPDGMIESVFEPVSARPRYAV